MTRLPLIVLMGLLAMAAPATAKPKGASVTLTECTTAAAQGERTAAFEARMRVSRPAQRLQMRFTLQSRTSPELRWERVDLPEWDQWVTADPGVGRYIYEKRVEGLATPAVYRAVVRFRWTNALGKVVRVARLSSEPCRQPDLRPDLRPLAVRVSDDGYVVPIANRGAGPSGPFAVVLTINGHLQPPQDVASLDAGERRELILAGPRCLPGTQVTVAADPQGQVEEVDEADNEASGTCSPG
jgi:hypothetical protein